MHLIELLNEESLTFIDGTFYLQYDQSLEFMLSKTSICFIGYVEDPSVAAEYVPLVGGCGFERLEKQVDFP